MCYVNKFGSKYLSLIILFCVLFSCKNESKVLDNNPILPTLPVEEIKYLLANAEATDFIFHDLPFSVNQTDLQSVRITMSGIGIEPVFENNCKSIGRLFVQVKGEILMEAEIYYDGPDCHHYVFYEDKKPKYANQMRASATGFYNDLIKSISNR